MALILEVKTGPMAGTRQPVPDGQPFTVGRTRRANLAVPVDSFLSGVHFSLEGEGETFRVVDRKSANGTFLNGQRITEAAVSEGDEIAAGQTKWTVHIVRASRPAPPEPHSQPLPVPSPLIGGRPVPGGTVEPGRASTPAEPLHPSTATGFSPETPPAPPAFQPPPLPSSPAFKPPPPPPAVTPAPPRPPSPIPGVGRTLEVGNWFFGVIPDGWDAAEGFGIRRTGKGIFPSEALVDEQQASMGSTLQQYMESQLAMVRELVASPRIDFLGPARISGAQEAAAVLIRYKTEDGKPFVQRQIYARSGTLLGVVTLTTLESEAPRLQTVFDQIVSGLSFRDKNAMR